MKYLYIIIIFSIVACSTHTLPIEHYIPASVTFDNSVKNIGILNLSYLDSNKNSIFCLHDGLVSGEAIYRDIEGTNILINVIDSNITKNKRFSTVIIPNDSLKTITTLFNGNFDQLKEMLSYFLRHYNLDAIIVLRSHISEVALITNVENLKREIKSDLRISSKALIEIYNSNIELVDLKVFSINDKFSSIRGKFRIDNFPNKRYLINSFSESIANQFVNRILPSKVFDNIKIYKLGYKAKINNNFINFDELISFFETKSQTKLNSKTKSLCLYNIAVIEENKGNFDKSLYYADSALRVYYYKEINEYILALKKRIKDYKLVTYQLTSK